MEFKNYKGVRINDVYADWNKWKSFQERYMKRFNNGERSKELDAKLKECRENIALCEDCIKKYKKRTVRKPWEEDDSIGKR